MVQVKLLEIFDKLSPLYFILFAHFTFVHNSLADSLGQTSRCLVIIVHQGFKTPSYSNSNCMVRRFWRSGSSQVTMSVYTVLHLTVKQA